MHPRSRVWHGYQLPLIAAGRRLPARDYAPGDVSYEHDVCLGFSGGDDIACDVGYFDDENRRLEPIDNPPAAIG